MIKRIVILFAIIAAAQAVGGWTDQTVITNEIMDLARWSTSQLSEYTNGKDHTIMTVKNLKTQIVSGVNYKFTLDVVVSLEDNKYEFKSCDISIYEQKWTQTKYFFAAPVCKALSSL